MRRPQPRTIEVIHATDSDGSKIAKVQLRDGRYAILDEADFANLLDRKISPDWVASTDTRYKVSVRMRLPSGRTGHVPVARLITNAPPRIVVKYIDGNYLNLRRGNLVLANFAGSLNHQEQT